MLGLARGLGLAGCSNELCMDACYWKASLTGTFLCIKGEQPPVMQQLHLAVYMRGLLQHDPIDCQHAPRGMHGLHARSRSPCQAAVAADDSCSSATSCAACTACDIIAGIICCTRSSV